jgi:hypothetical protein
VSGLEPAPGTYSVVFTSLEESEPRTVWSPEPPDLSRAEFVVMIWDAAPGRRARIAAMHSEYRRRSLARKRRKR